MGQLANKSSLLHILIWRYVLKCTMFSDLKRPSLSPGPNFDLIAMKEPVKRL